MATTPNRNYPLINNGSSTGGIDLNVDVATLLAFIGMVDADVQSLVTALAGKVGSVSPAFYGSPTAPTQATGDDSNNLATTAFVKAATALAIANLVNGAPSTLDALNELAAALGNDPNFSTTIATQLGLKANSVDVYLKTAIDTMLADKLDKSGANFASDAERLTFANAGKVLSFLAQTFTEAQAKQLRANMRGGFGPADAVYEDRKAGATNGGDSIVGWNIRAINTAVYDPASIIALSSNQVTPAVDVEVFASAPAFNTGAHKLCIYDVAAGTYIAIGTSEYISSTSGALTRSTVRGRLTAGRAYEFRHYIVLAVSSTGLGVSSTSGQAEVFLHAEFRRI